MSRRIISSEVRRRGRGVKSVTSNPPVQGTYPGLDASGNRIATKWPYAQNSYVNSPIKTTTTRIAHNLEDPGNGVVVVDPIILSDGIGGTNKTLTKIDYFYNNTLMNNGEAGVQDGNGSGYRHDGVAGATISGVSVKVTDDMRHNGYMNGLFCAPDSSGRYVHGGQALDRRQIADNPKIAYYTVRGADIYGSGLPEEQKTANGGPGGSQGHGGSGLPIFGMTIRDWEWDLINQPADDLDSPWVNIQHELCLNVHSRFLSATQPPTGQTGGGGYKSPASQADSGYNEKQYLADGSLNPKYSSYVAYGGNIPHMRNGALLALPVNYDFAANGISHRAARGIGWTLKYYGCRIGDITGKTERFALSVSWNRESAFESTAGAMSNFHIQVIRMILDCQIITNDAPGQWGGTGTPLVTPPPALILPS